MPGFLALLALFVFIHAAPSDALDKLIIRVPADYETVGAALDNASDHAIVELAGGLYRESLSITRPLVLRGKSGDTVVLVGSVDEPVITIADTADVHIEDLTISGGKYGNLRDPQPGCDDTRQCHLRQSSRRHQGTACGRRYSP